MGLPYSFSTPIRTTGNQQKEYFLRLSFEGFRKRSVG
jgi:hypothetical protein